MENIKGDKRSASNSGLSVDNSKFYEKPMNSLRNYISEALDSMAEGTTVPGRDRRSTMMVAPTDKIQEENEDYVPDLMTSSYTEISYEQESAGACMGEPSVTAKLRDVAIRDETLTKNPENEQDTRDKRRPSSLILNSNSDAGSTFTMPESSLPNEDTTSPLIATPGATGMRNYRCCEFEENYSWSRLMEDRGQQTSTSSQISIDGSPSPSSEELLSESHGYRSHGPCRHRRDHRRTGSDTSGLSELAGTLIVEGDVFSFVADDLQEKIRLSSPLSRKDSPSFPSSRVSTPSLYKQALQPHVPLVDAGVLLDLEAHALRVASGVDHMLENLSGTVQSISSLTVDCMETYQKGVCKTCDMVDSNIKSMYQLMAKCEELSNSMKPLYKISEEIKEIKRLVEHFENVMDQKS